MKKLINDTTTVRQFIELSLFYDLSEYADMLRQAPRPDELGGEEVPESLDWITVKQRFILSEISTDIDYLFIPSETILKHHRATIEGLPVLSVVGLSNFAVNELKRFSEAETELSLLNPPSDEERQAGVEGMPRDKFAVVDAIVKSRPGTYTHEQVLNLTVADVYAMQKIDTYAAIYAKRLHKILTKKYATR